MEKKRDREQGGILGGVAELFDLPVDVVAGLPRLELIGNRQLYLERHTGLLAYSDTQIDANTGFGVLRIRGERLTLASDGNGPYTQANPDGRFLQGSG